MMNVPAPPMRQYDNTPSLGVITLLGEEEEEKEEEAFNNAVSWHLISLYLFYWRFTGAAVLIFGSIWLVNIFIMDSASENSRQFP